MGRPYGSGTPGKVVLVDIDGASRADSVARVGASGNITQVASDATGVHDAFSLGLRACLDQDGEERVYESLLGLAYSYRLQQPPSLPATDVAVSSMVLSQLATPLTELLQRRFRERFPNTRRATSRELDIALAQLTHRVQHDHLRALLHSAPGVVVTSDVSEQYADGHGSSQPLPLIGAPSLAELFPVAAARVLDNAAWVWLRVPPARELDVAGCIAVARENE